MRTYVGFVVTLGLAVLGTQVAWGLSGERLQEKLKEIQLPPGFEISVYAEGVRNARSMVLSPQGTLFVGTRTAGKVYAVVDADKDYRAERIYTLLTAGKPLPDGTELKMPNGVAFSDGALYVAAVSHILRLDDIEARLDNPPEPVIVTSEFPTHAHHGWKFVAIGPDGKLYVPVGAWCNICEKDEEMFGTINRINLDGTARERVARGVRNSVGFDWHPVTKELWFTDNGRDGMGNDVPGDELNVVTRLDQHYGFPYIHDGDTPDPRLGEGHSPDEFVKPAISLAPHVAALGMRFYTGSSFPKEYRHQIFIAEHGSWNRAQKIGYRVMLVRLEGNKAVSYEPFATGWLKGQVNWGRPVDLLFLPDGSMLLSDDQAGVIYRITYKP